MKHAVIWGSLAVAAILFACNYQQVTNGIVSTYKAVTGWVGAKAVEMDERARKEKHDRETAEHKAEFGF